MKKYITIFISFIIVLSIIIYSTNYKKYNMTIMPSKLSKQEIMILDLVGVEKSSIFDYHVDNNVKSAIVEITKYEKGKTPEIKSSSNTNISNKFGRIEIDYALNDLQCRVAFKEKDGVSSATIKENIDNEDNKGYAKSILSKSLNIKLNEKIPLIFVATNNNGSISMYDVEQYNDKPELLNEYDSAKLITITFSDNEF
ncbi:hypothetical protein [uncultured Clostridium sp.]|uniref:hypothetical protein n=1 Tax=uncultured Clostridium sp. TaxID=59620 RepID=UPI0028EEE8CB|nr:hypothetical protein [uncultured Clostridium sp.]